MIIQFNDKYRINSDKHSWFIQEYKGEQVDKRDGIKKPVWKGTKWYSTFTDCLLQAAEMSIRTSSASTPYDCLAEITAAHTALDAAMQEYKALLKLETEMGEL
jgi:hypothetical protein